MKTVIADEVKEIWLSSEDTGAYDTQASHLILTKDVLGAVATLGKVDDENLSRSV